jgi:hypothetical protein
MAKNSPAPAATTEIMHPGQTSDALRVKLRQLGARITDDQIAAAWSHAEQARVSFGVAAVALGALLLAKKEALGHGKWIPCVREVWREAAFGHGRQIGHAESNFRRGHPADAAALLLRRRALPIRPGAGSLCRRGHRSQAKVAKLA